MAHLVWDWNGTLFDDLDLVVEATNASLAWAGGRPVTVDEHRRDFRRPVGDYYAGVLGRPLAEGEFADLDRAFHETYRLGLARVQLARDARDAIAAWPGSQSLLSMFFHTELVPLVSEHGLDSFLLRVDGLRDPVGGGSKTPFLRAHLAALGVDPAQCVLIGDSLDDGEAAATVGARAVLYSGGITDPAKLSGSGHPVADTLMAAIKLALAD